jgi:hypothetical protein
MIAYVQAIRDGCDRGARGEERRGEREKEKIRRGEERGKERIRERRRNPFEQKC